MNNAVSNAGIKQTRDGNAEVPESRRADGSVRASIKVRPGYIPPEDKLKYRSPRTKAETTMDDHINPSKVSKGATTAPIAATTKPSQVVIQKQTKEHANEILSAWSSAGWRGQETPSRFARKDGEVMDLAITRQIAKKKPPKTDKLDKTTLGKTEKVPASTLKERTPKADVEVNGLEKQLQNVSLDKST